MLIAEIRRKLLDLDDIDVDGPGVVERLRRLLDEAKEDLLTADVFGTLKYLPREPYLRAVLRSIGRANNESDSFRSFLPDLLSGCRAHRFIFWPSYPTPPPLGPGRTEPDVVVESDDAFILFEAKLGSGFGERQVERELAVALAQARGRQVFLILVTPGVRPPRFTLAGGRRLPAKAYLSALTAGEGLPQALCEEFHGNADRVLWISWQRILTALHIAMDEHAGMAGEDHESVQRAADLIGDLTTLVEMRGLRPFRAIGHGPWDPSLESVPRPLLLRSAPEAARRPLPRYSLAWVANHNPASTAWRCPRPSQAQPSPIRKGHHGAATTMRGGPVAYRLEALARQWNPQPLVWSPTRRTDDE